MNGKFIAENIESLDKNVIWNWYDCTPVENAPIITSEISDVKLEQPGKLVGGLTIKAWPNPGTLQFFLDVESNVTSPVDIRVYDMYGRLVFSTSGSVNRRYEFGNRFVSGTYIAEVRQGSNRSTVKLVKQ